MAYRVLTDRDEIGRADAQLRATLESKAPQGPQETKLGHQGGGKTLPVHWLSEQGIWAAFSKAGNGTRFWNSFGIGDPNSTDNLQIVVEINPPTSGRNRRCAGAFLVDESGDTYLAHSGKIGGGRPGIGKSAFLDWYTGPRVEADGMTYLSLGRVDSKDFAQGVADFVLSVQGFKDSVTGPVDPREFWELCADLLESYPDRPAKISRDAEVYQLGAALRASGQALVESLVPSSHWEFDASVGVGNWATVPWVACFDTRITTTAQEGVYPVAHFLFGHEQSVLRLGIGVAATEFGKGAAEEAARRSAEFDQDLMRQLEELGFSVESQAPPGDYGKLGLMPDG